MPPITKYCLMCSSPFHLRPSHAHKRHHCSKKCLNEAQRLRPFHPDRLWDKILQGDPESCWPWTGSRNHKGYGQISLHGKPRTASRVVWQVLHGDIPNNMQVLHRCDNPQCCNPAHLFLGTPQDNTQDMMRKERYGAKVKPERVPRQKQHGSHTKPEQFLRRLTIMQQQEIITLYATGHHTYPSLALQYDVSIGRIARLVRRHQKNT